MDASLVQVDTGRRDGVCLLSLRNSRKLNALSTAVERELAQVLSSAAVREASCVVVTGDQRAFSAGADITEFRERDPDTVLAYYRDTGAVYEAFAALPQPTIAAISGYCLGGGFELALAADFRIADTSAVFGLPEVGIGILPSSGGTVRLTRLLGTAQAKALILRGVQLDAAEAVRLGIVSQLAPQGSALDAALDLAVELATRPRLAMQIAKQTIEAVAESSTTTGILLERFAYGLLTQTSDAVKATERFMDS
jgi:enoyl-CoA hydratase/carnithine racemase